MQSTVAETFNNEWLWLGNLGHVFTVISFISVILSTFFYWRNTNQESHSDLKWGRSLFQLHSFAIVGIFVVLFSIIFFHRYEFHYAWKHSSNTLPIHFMISCFWEGQEGSFLLWLFWNAVIGLILQKVAKDWESSVLAVVGFAQIALSSMLIGFHIGDFKIGSSPFDLLREQRPDFLNIPILADYGVANYLKVFKDGNGLNPLLQNYWMVIHPPTLFLGFASAIVPFSYSIAALWRKNERGWLTPALIWSLVCVGILGLGIIMGGYWAYESLSFGGYWAWDPVENASLMPWLIMAAAAHMVLISRSTGRHLFTSHFLVQLTFWLVLYATFLTRSGILGDASVHSFTDLGLSGQLLLFLLAFIAISLIVTCEGKIRTAFIYTSLGLLVLPIILAYALPADMQSGFADAVKFIGIAAFFVYLILYLYILFYRTKGDFQDEQLNSREFWMFLGSMFLILSLVQVFAATSIPVFNKLFGFKTAVPGAESYNKIQLWLAMPIMLLMAVAHWFKFRETDSQVLWKSLRKISVIGIIFGVLGIWIFEISGYGFILFLILAILLITSNTLYIAERKGLEWKKWGGNLAHLGFGILLLGVLISSVNKKILSSSEQGIDIAPELDANGKVDEKGIKFNRSNQILYKNKPHNLIDYQATYLSEISGKGVDSINKYFTVSFVEKNKQGATTDSFVVHPKTQNNPKMGLLAEPSTKHFIHKDIFTHVNYESSMDKKEPYSSFKTDTVTFFEPFRTTSGKIELSVDSIQRNIGANGLEIKLVVKVKSLQDSGWLYPEFLISGDMSSFESKEAASDKLGVVCSISNLKILDPDPSKQNLQFIISTGEKTPVWDYIVLQVIEFPWINLVWLGTIIMVLGFVLSILNRIAQSKNIQHV